MKPIKYIKQHLFEVLNRVNAYQNSVPSLLLKKDIEKSALYAEEHMKSSMLFFKNYDIWDFVVSKLSKNKGIALEFGVFQGTSINHMSKQLQNFKFHGFDSFEGLQEDWAGWALKKGAFNLNGILPKVNSNVELHKGWFNKTLPVFKQNQNLSELKLIHIDSDTYEACQTILDELKEYVKPGLMILFDEYFGYRGWEQGEFKAFQEFIKKENIEYKYVALAERQVLIEII